MSSAGKWDRWYSLTHEPAPYGDDTTYRLAADFLAPCDLVEDWGCGKGWMRQFVKGDYRGIDGSCSPFADVIADLASYRSSVPGVVLRHVLEHDQEWARILDNAAASATERLAIILFTPLSHKTRQVAYSDDPGVPDISFRLEDLTDRLEGWQVDVEHVASRTQYEGETALWCAR